MKKPQLRLIKSKLKPPKPPKPKFYAGNPPDNAIFIAGTVRGWRLYERHTDQSGWANFKLIWNGERPKKANYWLGGDQKTGKLVLNYDAKILAEHEPKIFAWVEKMVVKRMKAK